MHLVSLLLQPLDTVKVRLQSERTAHLYKGAIDCLRQITAKEGVRHTSTLSHRALEIAEAQTS